MLNVRVLVDEAHRQVIEILRPLATEYGRRERLSVDYRELGNGPGSAEEFRRLLFEPTDLLIVDGHGSYENGVPWLMGIPLASLATAPGQFRAQGLALGACEGGSAGFVAELERALAGPMAFLGCSNKSPYEHGRVLWPALFAACEASAAAGGPVTAAGVSDVMASAREVARAARPQMRWDRWRARVLVPQSVPVASSAVPASSIGARRPTGGKSARLS